MKIRLLIFSCLYFLVIQQGEAQDALAGHWYTFARDHVIELTIREDSLLTKSLYWDLQPNIYSRHYYEGRAIIERRTANGKIYTAIDGTAKGADGEEKKKPAFISVFMLTRPGKELTMFAEEQALYTDTSSITSYIRSDTGAKKGMIFFSEPEILRLKALPSITTMNVGDCKRYCEKIKTMRAALVLEDAEDFYYSFFMGRYLVSEVGFSPLFSEQQFEAWFKRFENDPATKDIFTELFKDDY